MRCEFGEGGWLDVIRRGSKEQSLPAVPLAAHVGGCVSPDRTLERNIPSLTRHVSGVAALQTFCNLIPTEAPEAPGTICSLQMCLGHGGGWEGDTLHDTELGV